MPNKTLIVQIRCCESLTESDNRHPLLYLVNDVDSLRAGSDPSLLSEEDVASHEKTNQSMSYFWVALISVLFRGLQSNH